MAGQDEPNAFLMSIVKECEETGEDSDWKAIALYLMTPEGIAESERRWGPRKTELDHQEDDGIDWDQLIQDDIEAQFYRWPARTSEDRIAFGRVLENIQNNTKEMAKTLTQQLSVETESLSKTSRQPPKRNAKDGQGSCITKKQKKG